GQPLIPLSGGTTETPVTVPGSVVGTPGYMSPEQASGRPDELGPASDVYSLGATLHHLLTGKPPSESAGSPPPAQQGGRRVPAALAAVCRKARAAAPGDRYAGALELAADVEHWLADEPVSACREPWGIRLRRWLARHRTLVTGAAAAVVVAVASLT